MILGILLVIAGIFSLGYSGFTYTHPKEVANIGSVHVTQDKRETVYITPLVGVLAVAGGIAVMAMNRSRI
jgi:hypothetical protein